MIPPLHCENPLEHEGHEWTDADEGPVWCNGEVCATCDGTFGGN